MSVARKLVVAGIGLCVLAIAGRSYLDERLYKAYLTERSDKADRDERWYKAHRDQSFSSAILWKGRQACRNKQPCVFILGEVFPGDWDHVVVFDMAASQDEIDSTVGKGVTRAGPQRLIVFMSGSIAIRTMAESKILEHPEHGEVSVDRVPITANHIAIDRNANFVLVGGSPSCEYCTSLVQLRPGEMVE
jgi:hypothetical protein